MFVFHLIILMIGFFIIIIILDLMFGGNMWKKIKKIALIIWGIISVIGAFIVTLFLYNRKDNKKKDDDILKNAKERFNEKANSDIEFDDNGLPL